MNPVSLIPENAPFTSEQRAWLNGFIAGLLNQSQLADHQPPISQTDISVLILFGSQSGNAESLSKQIAKEVKNAGISARVASMDSVQPEEVAKQKNLLIITSTWGEGEMPDNAAGFWQGLGSVSTLDLSGLSYSVLALGDKNYSETFCLAGKKFDQKFEELGAKRIHTRVDCDVDFDQQANEWTKNIIGALAGKRDLPANGVMLLSADPEPVATYSRKNPFAAKLLNKVPLNKQGSAKDVHHIEFSLEGSGLSYQVGDALGVFPRNCPEVVKTVLENHGFTGEEIFTLPDHGDQRLFDALSTHYEIRRLINIRPERTVSVEDFIKTLKPLAPRLYSIASSPNAHPGEVHLTIGAVQYFADGFHHKGVCSTFLSHRLSIGEITGVYVQSSHGFRLPQDKQVPIIMVGPGTGIAPFRAFLEERLISGAKGGNWLFFGDQKSATDFLYQEQLEAYVRDGFLTHLTTAFSRDQEQKIYVQHRMQEHGKELWDWLQEGAHFYVCGDAAHMAKDVDAMLHEICRVHGGMDVEAAEVYIKQLKSEKRYQRDVY
jgi:sulfite reductase (NADPH) flavoprotein alpha-component